MTLLHVQQVPHHVLLVLLLHKPPFHADAAVCEVFAHVVLDLLGPDPAVPLKGGRRDDGGDVNDKLLQLQPPSTGDVGIVIET